MERKLTRRVLQVEGMKDAECERKIEDAFRSVEGIVAVKAMSQSSNVYVTYDANTIALDGIIADLEDLGCRVINKPSSGASASSQARLPAAGAGGQPGSTAETVLKIDGMTCTSCEMRIENRLKKTPGVIKAKVSYSSSEARVTYDAGKISLASVIQTIEKLDYKAKVKNGGKAGAGGKDDGAKDGKFTVNQLIGVGIIILAAYVIIKNTIGFNFIPQVDQSMGYGILFVVGLITSLHCVAMCGGINLSQCVSYKQAEGDNSVVRKLKPSLMYNGGRVISYTIVGGIVGALGSAVSFSGTAKGIIAILSGIFMVIMGLNMLNIFPWLRRLTPRMPKFFGNKIHAGGNSPFFVGIFNGLMPCGPLQAMQIYALGTGSPLAGALSMFMFSLGTVPLMFSFGAVSSFLSGKFTHRMMKVSAVLVMILGVIMLNRGLSLSGINVVAYASSGASSSGAIATVDGNIQNVTTSLQSGKYSPIVVQKGIPVKWVIKADASDINGCNGTIEIPAYDIEKKLVAGDNTIEFTPDKTGTIPYSCWMGMISSSIKVVDDVTKVSAGDVAQSGSSGGSGGLLGGCCKPAPPGFENGKIPTDNIQLATVNGNQQEVTITVDDSGYSPAVAVVQKGVPVKIKFDPKQLSSCTSTVVFPEYQGQLDLQSQTETPLLTPESDFTFQCGMGMLHGYVKVVDDINNVDMNAIRKEIQNYTPPAGNTGGCNMGGGY